MLLRSSFDFLALSSCHITSVPALYLTLSVLFLSFSLFFWHSVFFSPLTLPLSSCLALCFFIHCFLYCSCFIIVFIHICFIYFIGRFYLYNLHFCFCSLLVFALPVRSLFLSFTSSIYLSFILVVITHAFGCF